MGPLRREAQRLNHDYIGTEHLLLGLITGGSGAVRIFESIGLTPERVRAEVDRRVTPGRGTPAGQLPFTPAMKRVLEIALAEAAGQDVIREEHLLLGLIREGTGTAAQALAALGVTRDSVRWALGPPGPPE